MFYNSRFGNPEELKELIDAAHGLGFSVLLDVVHRLIEAIRGQRVHSVYIGQ